MPVSRPQRETTEMGNGCEEAIALAPRNIGPVGQAYLRRGAACTGGRSGPVHAARLAILATGRPPIAAAVVIKSRLLRRESHASAGSGPIES